LSEKQEITSKTVGFSWHVSVEVEHREVASGGIRYPDKTVTKMSLGGHADDYEAATIGLEEGALKIREEMKKHG
jgi:hypothetical protein